MSTQTTHTFDAIVIGSGYGGSVAVARLSETGLSTLLIERGKEYEPGDFPEKWKDVFRASTISANKNKDPEKLYQFHLDDNAPVLVGSGLGGTSLINANIGMVPENAIFQEKEWPKVIQQEKGKSNSLLEQGYQKAKQMLQPNATPSPHKMAKIQSLERVAKGMNKEFGLTENYVYYGDKTKKNVHGVTQTPCTHCGNCITGCNVGAKNTLAMNYLPYAKNRGCTIVTETLVKHLKKDGDTWVVHCEKYLNGDKVNDNLVYKAKYIFIAAGSLGSTRLLLESQKQGLSISKAIGSKYSGNGDFLGLAYNSKYKVNGVGIPYNHQQEEDIPGACITSVVKHRGSDPKKNYIIEDAVIPVALADILPFALRMADEENEQDIIQGEKINHRQELQEHISKEDGAYKGAIQNTQTFLVMSDDGAKGKLRFSGDKLIIDWEGIEDSDHFKYINGELRAASDTIEADYIPSPLYTLDKLKFFKKKVITVHPLGGCPMGDTSNEGVVNHKGQVYSGKGNEVYDNLYVTDGAIVPRALAANPSLTIAALSERIMELFKTEHHLSSNPNTSSQPQQKSEKLSVQPGVTFTETMRGKFILGGQEIDFNDEFIPFEVKKGGKFILNATVTSNDYKELLSLTDLDHYARLDGNIRCGAFSKYPILFQNGTFELFRPQMDNIFDYRMIYNFTTIPTANGDVFRFSGQKFVKDDDFGNAISDTTTLYYNIYKQRKGESEVYYGKGIIQIKVLDLIKQYFTIKGINVDTKKASRKIKRAFLAGFSSDLLKIYGKFLSPDKLEEEDLLSNRRSLICEHRKSSHKFTTSDNHELRLTRYQNTDGERVLLIHPFNCSSEFFAVDTVKTNMVEYLWETGYDVWLLDYRLSCLLPYDEEKTDLDTIARIDIPEAIQEMNAIAGEEKPHIIAHCVGSAVTQLATLQGYINPESLHLFSFGTFPEGSRAVNFKSRARIANILNFIGVRFLSSTAKKHDKWTKRFLSRLAKIYAFFGGTNSNNPVLNRCVFMFGGMIVEDNINQATSDQLYRLFGAANMRTFVQLTDMIRKKALVDTNGNELFEQHKEKLQLPIYFYQGEKNGVFKKTNTYNSYKRLSKEFPNEKYGHHYFKDYGHIDPIIGKNASKEVYPIVTKNLMSCTKQLS